MLPFVVIQVRWYFIVRTNKVIVDFLKTGVLIFEFVVDFLKTGVLIFEFVILHLITSIAKLFKNKRRVVNIMGGLNSSNLSWTGIEWIIIFILTGRIQDRIYGNSRQIQLCQNQGSREAADKRMNRSETVWDNCLYR